MKKAVWITYDFGIQGDFPSLYTWLDDHNAVECGYNTAHLSWDDNGNGDIANQIKDDLNANIEFNEKKDRIYVVFRKDDTDKNNISGRFIVGKRKANPWTGHGVNHINAEDDEC